MTNKKIKKEIKKITDQIVKNYKPKKIILYGSTARGHFGNDSDIDMLIVKDTSKRRVDRIKDILFSVDYTVPFEPIVYTPKELIEREKIGDNFILEVLKQGKVLYEKQN